MEYKAYCVTCKKKVDVSNPTIVEIKGVRGTRRAVKGTCLICKTKVSVFIKKE